MTFTEGVNEVCARLNLTSPTAIERVGVTFNRVYKKITTSIGLNVSRHAEVQANASLGSQYITFDGVEKVNSVIDKSSGQNRFLDEVSITELDKASIIDSDTPTKYAIYRSNAGSVQIKTNANAQSAYTLYAPGFERAAVLSGNQEPAFPESFHDIIVEGTLIEEYLKLEKPQLSQLAKANYEDRMGDLRIFIAKSPQQDIYQGKMSGTSLSGVVSGGSGSSTNGATSYTQTGLITFDRDPSAPFAVTSGSAVVANLDADKLDGHDSTYFATASALAAHHTQHESGGSDAIKLDDLSAPDDNTDLNVSSTKHGLAPKSPASATQFLNGAATPAFAAVKDSDLSSSDVTTNNVTTAKHGFVVKAPNDPAQVFRGDAAWGVGYPLVMQGRLTLTTAVPVTRADVSAATTLYFTPYGGNRVSLYDGTNWKLYTFTERSIAIPATTSTMYDVFLYDNAGTLTLELLAWTNDSTRATALTTQDGVLVKTGATTRRFLGSVRTTTVSGQTESSDVKRYLSNYYNRVRLPLRKTDANASWNYSLLIWRQANGAAANQVDAIVCWDELLLTLDCSHVANNSGGNIFVATAIGEDSTSVPSTRAVGSPSNSYAASSYVGLHSHLSIYPTVGRHFYAWLEISQASGTTTWYGTNTFAVSAQSMGLIGFIDG